MPQIYSQNPPRRRSSSSASSSSSSSIIRPIDADDSIVLSDLVRTGEASRLRRRGAMRIDHSALSQSGPRGSSPTLVIVERPSWDSDYDLDLAEGHLGRTTSLRYPRQRRRPSRRFGPYTSGEHQQEEQPDEYVYTLVCGAEVVDYDSDEKPFKPSILPLYPPTASSSRCEAKQSTGCGTLIHLRAAPRPRVGMWSAHGSSSSAVVPLDAEYFETREAAKFSSNSCGCVKQGVGCAICGNPLGTRYIPCPSVSESFLSSRNVDKRHSSSRLRGPEGPQYWHASSSQAQDFTVYSFFSNSVTSTPAYEFPAPKSRHHVYSEPFFSDASLDLISSPPPADPATEPFSEDEDEALMNVGGWQSVLSPTVDEENSVEPPANMILDRFAASSPTPLSDDAGDDTPTPLGWNSPLRSHPRQSRIYPLGGVSRSYSPPFSFYQQQVIGAWERERESDREEDRRRPSRATGFDPDGESVWGLVDPDGAPNAAADFEEPGTPDKTTEMFLFPER